MWKQGIATKPDSIILDANKRMILAYDQSSKNHLTTAKGNPNVVDYKSTKKTYHGKELQVDKDHIDIDLGVHKVMKTTTYQIGKEGKMAPNEKTSSNQQNFVPKLQKEEELNGPPKFDKNSRRCDPENPNRVLTVGFGHGSEKGTVEH